MEAIKGLIGGIPPWVLVGGVVVIAAGVFIVPRLANLTGGSGQSATNTAPVDPNIDPNTGVPYSVENAIGPNGLPNYNNLFPPVGGGGSGGSGGSGGGVVPPPYPSGTPNASWTAEQYNAYELAQAGGNQALADQAEAEQAAYVNSLKNQSSAPTTPSAVLNGRNPSGPGGIPGALNSRVLFGSMSPQPTSHVQPPVRRDAVSVVGRRAG